MYTAKPYPGKFEGNHSQMLARAVYNASLDGCCDTLGDSESFGFYAYVTGKRNHYILSESSNGFVSVDYGPESEMVEKWVEIEKEWEQFNSEMDEGK